MRARTLVFALLASLLASIFASPQAAAAQNVPGVTRRDSVAEFDFQDVELRIVLSALAEAAGLNVVYSNLPSRSITLRTSHPVPIAEVRGYLESVVRAHGLSMVQEGGLIRISGGEGAPGEPGPAGGAAGAARVQQDQLRLFVYALRHAQADALAQTLTSLFGLSGAGPVGGELEGARALSDELRAQRLPPNYLPEPPAPPARAGQVPIAPRAGGESVSGSLRGQAQIVADQRTNSLLIRATAADYETIRAAVLQLDTRPLQVLIEVLIAEVRRDRNFALGISTTVPDSRIRGTQTTVGGSVTGAGAGDLVVSILDIGKVKADVVLRSLSENSTVTILSRPVVLAQNNQEARVLVGSERPFIQLFRALPTDAAVRDQVVQYRDVGTQLTIRPTINPDGYVSMSVLQEVSNATAETQFGAPIISTREARTQLLVKDNQTAVIGGLIDQQREQSASGIPILKDLPLIGPLFRSTQQRRRGTTELFIFLTPHVLRTDEDVDDATRRASEATDNLRRELPDTLPVITMPPRSTPP
ncbi:MAG TPA: secretin N-terminal domain-containing protein [Gemmatimonadaceae bacterium]|nr:secretin N-terminal domain-containing protein [Gemmatimonadaceae bacterium]